MRKAFKYRLYPTKKQEKLLFWTLTRCRELYNAALSDRKIRNQRRDFLHKQAHKLIQEHQAIVFEELQVTNLTKRAKPKQDETGKYLPNGASAKSGLTKSILDAGWGQFQQMCASKAEYAGRTVLVH